MAAKVDKNYIKLVFSDLFGELSKKKGLKMLCI